MATHNTPYSEHPSLEEAISLKRLQGIGGTSGVIATSRRLQGRDGYLVKTYQENKRISQ